jgi:hypothetical protein
VAVGGSGTILTSPDGATWISRISDTTSYFRGVNYGNGTFVAVGDTTINMGNSTILTSPDGVTWTSRTSGTVLLLFGVSYGNDTFVAVGWLGCIIQSGMLTAPSSDATLKATSAVKGQTVTSLGTPNETLGSVTTAGAVTITAAKAADTTEATTFVTLFDKNDASATVKAVKYAAGGDTGNFATDAAYTNPAITDGDFFIIKVTAADTTTINYYKVVVTVTPASGAELLIISSNANVTIDHTGKKITYPMYSIDGTDFTQLANIKSVISAATGYTYEIYEADGTTVATAMDVTNKLKVLQGENIVETYTFAANIKYGDVNGNGALNTADLTLLARYIVNSINYPFEKAYGIKAADINKDNVVDSSDKVLLQRYLNNAQNYPIPSPTEFLYDPI